MSQRIGESKSQGIRFQLSPFGGLVILAIVYLALAITLSQTMHFSRAFDEGYHLEYVTFLKQHGRLPLTYAERAQITRADFPPLYQLLVALVSAGVDADGPPDFKLFWDSFRYRAMDHQTEAVWTINTEDYRPPYFGRFLVWQIGRWVSVVLSLGTVIIVFLTLREIPLGRNPWLALAGAALLAFIPRYIILGSTLNDDNLLGLLAALYFWMLVKTVNRPERWWPFVGMGIFLGFSMTVKYTLVVVPLEIGLVCLLLAQNKNLGWAWAWPRIGLVGIIALLCGGWWFGWNLWFLNTVAQDGWFAGLLRPLMAGGADATMNRLSGLASGGQIGRPELPEDIIVGTFPQWLQTTFLSFWGISDFDSPFSAYIYLAIGLILAVAGFGLWRLWQADPAARRWLALLILHTGIFVILPLVRFGLTRRLSVAAQGRHILIPAAAAVAGLLVWGLNTALPKQWRRLALTMILIGFMGWTGGHIYFLAASGPAALPLRAMPQAAAWLPDPVKAKFGDSVELVSYGVDPQPERGLLGVNLAWRSLAYTNESYLLKVTLTNSAGEVVSHWLGYNGQGRLPTLAWDPGDSIFDRLALPLPNLPAGEYRLQVEMLNGAGPLGVSAEAGEDTALTLADISLAEPTHLALSRRMRVVYSRDAPIEANFDLWQADGPVKANAFPTYRYPGTVSVVVSDSSFDEAALKLELVAETGQAWPVTQDGGNIYHFVIGPRWRSGDYCLRITWQKGDEVLAQATSELMLRIENWWERKFDPPKIAMPLAANFANQVKLLGYKLPQTQVKAGEAFPLTLYWQAFDRPPQADFIQFNHLLDESGTLRGGYDRYPLEYYSTLLWSPGEVVVDGYAVPVDVGAPPGEYFLDVGYYLTVGESAVNLPLVVGGQMTDVTRVTIGPVEVVAP
ncbi:MAG: glycosyltransferase family 39 protein [Anaerolineae bacterium]|nr:glycosyltransferase family 39 protein [Anaerolineae bacterium]